MARSHGEVETFRSHSNWIRAFATLAGLGATSHSSRRALTQLAGHAATLPVPAGSRGQPRDVFPCLHRAWGTELLLNVARRLATEDELLRLANSWGAVQAYYAAYGATQALIVAEGRSRPVSHPATQRQFVDMWVHRAEVALPPWSLSIAAPNAPHADLDGVVNGPGRKIDSAVHAWSACTTGSCWDIASMALRSTRQDAVKEQLQKGRTDKLRQRQNEWRRSEATRTSAGKKPRQEPAWPASVRLTVDEASRIRNRVRPYTVLDYLFRLRIKANYEDARMFTEGPENPGDSSQVARDLMSLTAATMLVHEIRVARLIGPTTLLVGAEDWLRRNNPPGLKAGLAARIDLLRSVPD